MIQLMYGIGLKLQYCEMLVDESPEQVKAALDEVLADLGDAIDEIRTKIYALH
jgi:signal transduction histidine kinase